MQDKFSRTELLIGSDGLEKMKSARAAVFGLGGVGGYVVEALVRSGLGEIDIVDNDVFSASNLNRQIFATVKTIGKLKVDGAEERIKDINPEVKVYKHNMFFSPENSSEFDFSKCDYIVDAIDTVSGKIELVMKACEYNIPIISSMGAGNKIEPSMFEVCDIYKTSVCPLAKVMRQELKKRGVKKLKVVYSKETPKKIQNFSEDIAAQNNEPFKKCPPASIAFVHHT